MTQRRLKQRADSQGILLRPQDPNVAVAGQKSAILAAGRKRSRSGAASADAVLGASSSGGSGGSDPLAKKVKVRVPKKRSSGTGQRGCYCS